MIRYPQGWHRHLLRREGVLAAALHACLTRNSFKPGNQAVVKETLHCLPSYKPFRWYRDLNARGRSFVSREVHAFLQIGLSLVLHHLNGVDRHGLAEGRLLLPEAPFPAIGFRSENIAVFLCRPYPSQGLTRFDKHLETERRFWCEQGVSVRWLMPFSLAFPQKRRLGPLPRVDGASLRFVLEPELEERRFWLDLANVYRNLKRVRSGAP